MSSLGFGAGRALPLVLVSCGGITTISVELPDETGAKSLLLSTETIKSGRSQLALNAIDLTLILEPSALPPALFIAEADVVVRYAVFYFEPSLEDLRLRPGVLLLPSETARASERQRLADLPGLISAYTTTVDEEDQGEFTPITPPELPGALAGLDLPRRRDCASLIVEEPLVIPFETGVTFLLPLGPERLILGTETSPARRPRVFLIGSDRRPVEIENLPLSPDSALLGPDGSVWFLGRFLDLFKARPVLTATTAYLAGVEQILPASATATTVMRGEDRVLVPAPADCPNRASRLDNRITRSMAGEVTSDSILALMLMDRDGALSRYQGGSFECIHRIQFNAGGQPANVIYDAPRFLAVSANDPEALVHEPGGILRQKPFNSGENPSAITKTSRGQIVFGGGGGSLSFQEEDQSYRRVAGKTPVYALREIRHPSRDVLGLLLGGERGTIDQYWPDEPELCITDEVLGVGSVRFIEKFQDSILAIGGSVASSGVLVGTFFRPGAVVP